MTIQQLKDIHAKIMDLIIKSNSDSATVIFRTFGTNPQGEQEYMVDFFDKTWFQWNGGNPPTLYSRNGENEGQDYVELVKRFLNR